jgi:hypothetical protein
VSKDQTYGIAVKEYICSHGRVLIVKHPLLEGAYHGSWGILLDMKNVEYVYLRNRNTSLHQNTVPQGTFEGRTDEVWSDFGLGIALQGRHGIITGVNS